MSAAPAHSVSSFQKNARLEAFSDGVFAIVVTLLVIELALPEIAHGSDAGSVFAALWDIRAKLVAYFICFLFVGQLWVAHTNLFRLVVKTDSALFWQNNVLLMFTSLFPFAAAILGDYPENPGAVMVFGTLFCLTGLAFGVMSTYCVKRALFHAVALRGEVQRGNRWATLIGVASLPPLALALWWPRTALFLYFLIILAYIALQRIFTAIDLHEET